MTKTIKSIVAVTLIILSGYSLWTKNNDLSPYIVLLLGILMTILGVDEFQKGRKIASYITFAVALFAFIVFVQGLFFI
ncbi:DUF3953 domain-containing protein [Oceanobacillus halophilus]|uniref:DUF3953 domain-containing protein n=1 Tax=Oceanobacillus halophilus TaxID=930130 RepID=A0A494ZYU8_9BACI|nr:DUF3953 domain-containing protein [Oceanobacillus halophilus]RKQ31342.1 DUF3953 domain-containing protein [Oceanobacillus halophilus]